MKQSLNEWMKKKKDLHEASCQLVMDPNPCFPDGRFLQPHLGWGEALCLVLAFFVSMSRPSRWKTSFLGRSPFP